MPRAPGKPFAQGDEEGEEECREDGKAHQGRDGRDVGRIDVPGAADGGGGKGQADQRDGRKPRAQPDTPGKRSGAEPQNEPVELRRNSQSCVRARTRAREVRTSLGLFGLPWGSGPRDPVIVTVSWR